MEKYPSQNGGANQDALPSKSRLEHSCDKYMKKVMLAIASESSLRTDAVIHAMRRSQK